MTMSMGTGVMSPKLVWLLEGMGKSKLSGGSNQGHRSDRKSIVSCWRQRVTSSKNSKEGKIDRLYTKVKYKAFQLYCILGYPNPLSGNFSPGSR